MIKTHTLPNGLRIVMERLPYLRSASIGVFIKAASIMEAEHETGLSHFLEHMAFKGSPSRSAKQLAEEIDLIGGNVNAETSKVCTSFYARTTDTNLPRAITLLADMVMHPLDAPADFERERQVILEEIGMENDTPEDLVYNLLHSGLYEGQSLSRTILGTKSAISGYTINELADFRKRFYQPVNAVISVTGRFEEEELKAALEEAFGDWDGREITRCPPNAVKDQGARLSMNKNVEQTQLCIGYKALPSLHEDRYALIAMSTALGGGVSSRLFQRVREQEGLVYQIYCAPSFYPDCGDFTVYAACAPQKASLVLDLIQSEIKALVQDGITEEEWLQTMAQIKTGYVLGMESAYQRMASMGFNLLLHDRLVAPREVLANMRRVKKAGINRVARTILSGVPTIAMIGKEMSRVSGKKGGSSRGQA